MFKTLLFLIFSSVSLLAFDPAGPPPEKTIEWTVRSVSTVRIPTVRFEEDTVADAIQFINQTGAPKAYRAEIDSADLGEKSRVKITLKASDLTIIDLLGRIAQLIDADIRIAAGRVLLVPRPALSTVLLITSPELAEAWKPFAEWKTSRGKPTTIVTTAEIAASFEGPDIQGKIRRCVRRHIDEKAARWIILGGDSQPGGKGVVPDRDTVHQTMWGRAANIPTDIYYISSKNWDFDGDGVYGQFDAKKDPSIAESMLRQPKAGAIAVVAPCREGKPHFLDPQRDLP